MKTITIVEQDRVGLLMDISYILGKERINIESISANAIGGKAIITLTVRDGNEAKKILVKNGFHIIEEDMLMVSLRDRPGELATLAKLMKDNGINLVNLYMVSKDAKNTIVAIKPDKPKKARELLKSNKYNIEE